MSKITAVLDFNELDSRRRVAAEDAFEKFDFGSSDVEDMEGWARTMGSEELTPDDTSFTRNIFLAGEGEGANSDRVTFVVRFEPGTDTVHDAGVSGW